MAREASGTAWQPDSTPHQGIEFMTGEWMLMDHANLLGATITKADRVAPARHSRRAC